MNFINYLAQYIELIPSFPFVIQIALSFIFINTIAALFFMTSIYLVRHSKKKKEDIEEELYPKQKSFFLEKLKSPEEYSPEDISQVYISKFKKLSNKAYPPLIEALEDVIKENIQLLDSKNYLPLITGLKINEYLIKKLDFSNTRIRLRTFQSLATLDLTVPDSSILPHTYSKNQFLRKESRNSYIAISNHDPFKFFDHVDNTLNQWDQINLMEQLKAHHKNNLPNFSKWIKYSKNNSQLIFIIRAVANFDQRTSISSLIDILKTGDHETRKEVIIALGQMRVQEVEEQLINIYFDQPIFCQNAIIEALLEISSGHAINFLKTTYEQASNLDSKKLIAEVLYRYNDEGKAYIESLYQKEAGFNKLILEHVKNPLIPSRFRLFRKSTKPANQYATDQASSSNLNFSI